MQKAIGFPNFGTGSHGTVHITTDPEEMANMVRNEGACLPIWICAKFMDGAEGS